MPLLSTCRNSREVALKILDTTICTPYSPRCIRLSGHVHTVILYAKDAHRIDWAVAAPALPNIQMLAIEANFFPTRSVYRYLAGCEKLQVVMPITDMMLGGEALSKQFEASSMRSEIEFKDKEGNYWAVVTPALHRLIFHRRGEAVANTLRVRCVDLVFPVSRMKRATIWFSNYLPTWSDLTSQWHTLFLLGILELQILPLWLG